VQNGPQKGGGPIPWRIPLAGSKLKPDTARRRMRSSGPSIATKQILPSRAGPFMALMANRGDFNPCHLRQSALTCPDHRSVQWAMALWLVCLRYIHMYAPSRHSASLWAFSPPMPRLLASGVRRCVHVHVCISIIAANRHVQPGKSGFCHMTFDKYCLPMLRAASLFLNEIHWDDRCHTSQD